MFFFIDEDQERRIGVFDWIKWFKMDGYFQG